MEKQLILTSSIAPVADHIYDNYLKDKGYESVLHIGTAAKPELNGEKENDQWYHDDFDALVKCGYDVLDYDLSDHTKEETLGKIADYDILYMSGGNTFYMLQELQEKDLMVDIKKIVEEGKLYMGTSTGSIITGKSIEASRKINNTDLAPDIQNTDGFGLVNFTILPHWNSGHFRQFYLDNRLDHAYDNTTDPLLLLNDNQYAVVDNESRVTVIDTKN